MAIHSRVVSFNRTFVVKSKLCIGQRSASVQTEAEDPFTIKTSNMTVTNTTTGPTCSCSKVSENTRNNLKETRPTTALHICERFSLFNVDTGVRDKYAFNLVS